ncbi:protein KRTCAP2 protein [Trifolium repens]|nr:protein KRTCAP2 protein [Trifolium repens]
MWQRDLKKLESASSDLSEAMAGSGSSMTYSFLLFIVILSLQEMYRGKLASSELYTILGGFISSLLFLVLLTFIGNFQETTGAKSGWGAVIIAEVIALIAASTVHRVCITTCFLFSAVLLYEVNKLSGSAVSTSDSRTKKQSVFSHNRTTRQTVQTSRIPKSFFLYSTKKGNKKLRVAYGYFLTIACKGHMIGGVKKDREFYYFGIGPESQLPLISYASNII